MTLNKFSKIYHTIKHLKPIQVRYQLWYRFKRKLGIKNEGTINGTPTQLSFQKQCATLRTYLGNQHFKFINIEQHFNDIDWNYGANGKLWVYNLNYFDFLNQEKISKEEGVLLINDFVSKYEISIDGKEPYPTSLRIINWIKFVSKHGIIDKNINDIIRKDTYRLTHSLEYHLLGNHLLENAFALTFASYYFSNEKLKTNSVSLLRKEMKEQILNDGAHYELSPMYHQLMTFRVLDLVNILEDWDDLKADLITYANRMLSWLEQISFKNGDIPYVNDSAVGVTPSTMSLMEYASKLDLTRVQKKPFKDSGYRKKATDKYELLMDIGKIGPSYQPGHAHADTLQFVLHSEGKPFIVDRGTSTYTIGKLRTSERASNAHNVVTINGLDSSQVWSGFRVARRAEVSEILESENEISASHNGYKNSGVNVNRKWLMKNESIEIIDKVGPSQKGILHLHFHDLVEYISLSDNEIVTNLGRIKFNGKLKLELHNYELAKGMNKTTLAKKAVIHFTGQITTKIYL